MNNNSNDSNDSSDLNDFLEDKIILLKIQIEEYDKLSNQDKIKNVEKYNKMIKEKDDYVTMLEKYKEMFILIDKKNNMKKKGDTPLDDELLAILLNDVYEIKTSIETHSNIKLDELIKLYDQLTETKFQLDSYFQSKTMEIIKL